MRALVVQRQKVIVLTKRELDGLSPDKPILIRFRKNATARIVRRSECPDPDGEYGKRGEKTYTVLLQIDESVGARQAVGRFSTATNEVPEQANNFVLSSEPSGDLPSPPIQAGSTTEKVQPSDFQVVDRQDYDYYPDEGERVVAVVDSGIKFDLANAPHQSLYMYTDHAGRAGREFRLSRARPACEPVEMAIGYCGVTDYLFPPLNIPELDVLRGLPPARITGSAFDDNRVLNHQRKPAGRHGTYLTAIINQYSPPPVSVLPVKAFNCGGFGTLFDVLCCLNYVLAQKDSGLPIQVLNASWVGQVDEDGEALLRSKFRQIEQAGILVVAAAGNQHRDLGDSSQGTLYPACFSRDMIHVITVTCVQPIYCPNDTQTSARGGYEVAHNYSKELVSVGVHGGRPSDAAMENPFNYPEPLEGTSFATARVSGLVARYLYEQNITLTKDTIALVREKVLEALTRHELSLEPFVEKGRLLKTDGTTNTLDVD